MFKRSILILLSVVLVAGLTTSCILDPKEEKNVDPPEPVVFKDLLERDDVLFNLGLAYNERAMVEYNRLLDDNFVFIFSEADFNSGTTAEQWERAAEVESNTKILSQSNPDPNRVISIDLVLDYVEGLWTEEASPPEFGDESWFGKTVTYRLVVKTADSWEYRAIDLKARYTIRWAETDNGDYWRIVRWRDGVE
jgi:hypothetical protein